MLANKLMGGSEDTLYVDDVSTSYLRTGTGADTTVTTNIDMTKGYMLWTKGRSGATDHAIYDSARGVTLDLASNTTGAQTTQSTGLKAVSATGHTVGSLDKMNTSGATYVDFVFRKAPKFFDVVTWTKGTNTNNRIPHALGSIPGCIIIKSITSSSQWFVWHRTFSNPLRNYLILNATDAVATAGADFWGASSPTATDFGINDSIFGSAGEQWVAYLFAHDAGGFGLTGTDNVISCGSFNYQTFPHTVELGYEPQWLMVKQYDGTGDWIMFDNMRGLTANSSGAKGTRLLANTSGAETTSDNLYYGSATGFNLNLPAYGKYIYLAIRRPNKPPTSGTEVYNGTLRPDWTLDATYDLGLNGFDLVGGFGPRGSGGYSYAFLDRLRGQTQDLKTASTAEGVAVGMKFVNQSSISPTDGTWGPTKGSAILHAFRRAPGFFDEVCYTGDATASRTVTHNLTAIPELMIVKARSGSGNWYVWYSPDGTAILNSTGQGYANDRTTFGAVPTASVFTCDNADVYDINASGVTYVAYLFASLPGISKVGSYTGNGTFQTINCRFTTGARFVLIKRTDSTGDWYVWDTTRGIVADNDPHLSLNTTAAEVTDNDSVDPESSGFIVNQNAATNINVNGGSYIFLAIA